MPQPTPPFPSLPTSKEALLDQLKQDAIELWGEQRAAALQEILEGTRPAVGRPLHRHASQLWKRPQWAGKTTLRCPP